MTNKEITMFMNDRHNAMLVKAIEKIPEVVNQMTAYELGKDQQQLYRLVVDSYRSDGRHDSNSTYTVDEDDIINHVRKAKYYRAEITMSDAVLTIKRTFPSGNYNIGTYTPITE